MKAKTKAKAAPLRYRRHVGPKFSEGARLLWAALERKRLSFGEAAEVLGWTRPILSNVLYGERAPTIAMLVRVARAFGVPLASWASSPRRAFVTPAARA